MQLEQEVDKDLTICIKIRENGYLQICCICYLFYQLRTLNYREEIRKNNVERRKLSQNI